MSYRSLALLQADTTPVPAGTVILAHIGQDIAGNFNFLQSWQTIVGHWAASLATLLGQPTAVYAASISPDVVAVPGWIGYRDAGVSFAPTWDTSIAELAGLLNGLSVQVSILDLTIAPGVKTPQQIDTALKAGHAGIDTPDISKLLASISLWLTIGVIVFALFVLWQSSIAKKIGKSVG